MMARWTVAAAVGGLLLLAGTLVMSQATDQAERRGQYDRAFREGNFAEAYQGYQQLCRDAENDPRQVSHDLRQAVMCLRRLGRDAELDELLEATVAVHADNWRLLSTAARLQAREFPHHGFLIAGQFVRGNHRGGGKMMSSAERDRTRALQLLVEARRLSRLELEQEKESTTATEVAALERQLASFLMRPGNQGDEAWRLQYLTDLSELPDYQEYEHHWFGGQQRGAPVDREGNPIYHQLPESWEEAKSDGERWRWSLQQAVELDPKLRNSVLLDRAMFHRQQFGVETLQQFSPWFRGATSGASPESESQESGTYALDTLEDHETIARLAVGVRRFSLPDEMNPIRLYQQIVQDPETGHADTALHILAETFENRRQYPRALEYWREAVRQYGDSELRRGRIRQIVGDWGAFDVSRTQAAGQGATVDFRFRNAKRVELEAHAVQVESLLRDVKTYLRQNPQSLEWHKINIADIGWRLVENNETEYIGERVAQWHLDLEPRPGHFDRRITITTPLQKAGAYLLTARFADGNVTKSVLWVADTALVQKTGLDGELYYVGDAESGTPIAGANVEFFGYRQQRNRQGQVQTITNNFAERSDAHGLVRPDRNRMGNNLQWLAIARTPTGGLAYTGFQGVWRGRVSREVYREVKAFGMTDRPVYRPGQTMNFKIWVGRATYDERVRESERSEFAGRKFEVSLLDPRGEKVMTREVTADDYGGIEGEYLLPDDATLGVYRFQFPHALPTSFRVEEYKKPEYEVTVDAPSEPVMLGESITATIRAKYYFGSPVTRATVNYKITRTTHEETWFPRMPWDWCYGPGYWWFAYDYRWYPGWDEWSGCLRPLGPWWPRRSEPPEVIAEQEVEIGEDGTVQVEIDTRLAKEIHGDQDHQYTIVAEVRDQSRRTIVGQGNILVAREPFKVYTWLNRGYYRAGDTVEANFLAQTLDRRPVTGKGVATLYRIRYDQQRQPIETAVETWELDPDSDGRARLPFIAANPGQYRLAYQVTDRAEHTIEGAYLFTVTGAGFGGSRYRFAHLELIPDQREYRPGEKVRLQINTDRIDSTVLLFVRPVGGAYPVPQVLRIRGQSTIHELDVELADMPNFHVEAVTISGGRVHQEVKEIVVPPEKRILNVEVAPVKDELRPGEEATVSLHVTDFHGENFVGSLAATIYDKSVEYISGGSNVSDIKEYFWKWRRSHYPQHQTNLTRTSRNHVPPNQQPMLPLGIFGSTVADDMDIVDGLAMDEGAMLGGAMAFGGMGGMGGAAPGRAMMRGAEMAEGVADKAMAASPADGEAADAAPDLVPPTIRSEFADTAFWDGSLLTDKEGRAELKLKMPENLTTWKVRVWGMGQGMRVGSGDAEMITRKDLILRMQTPRFAVQTDEVVLSANVHNYLPSEKEVEVSLELDGEVLETSESLTRRVMIPSDGEVRVDWRVRVTREGLATVRMKALTDEESDAMQLTFPCRVHGILKTESWAGTLRPEEERAAISIVVPQQRRPEESVLEVRYSPTLAGAMVDALPYLIDYPYGCTEQTLNRFLPAVITQRVLQSMNLDLAAIREKRTNLNPQEIGDDVKRAEQWQRYDREAVFDPIELDRIVKDSIVRLTNMQMADGGWGWFGGFGERSTPHTTALVMRGLLVAQENDVAIVPDVMQRGVAWLTEHQQEQIRRIKNADGKKDPWKPHPDNLDALVYHVLDMAGQENEEMRGFLYRDRLQLSVYGMALFGLSLHQQGYDDQVAMILRNIEQYLVEDETNETAYLRLPNQGYWWFWYGDEIEAHAAYLKLLSQLDPQGQKGPRLVKYLLNNRKHATYWRSTRDTAYCVEAFADFLKATGEGRPDMVVEIWLNGEKQKEVAIEAENLFSFDNRFVLQGDDVADGTHQLEIRRRGTGPVYFNAYLTNFTLEDPITRAGLEVQVQRKYYRLERDDREVKVAGSRGQAVDQRVERFVRIPLESLETVQSGDWIEIELEIESKNDYEYLMFEDFKPAGFEPLEVQSGHAANGLGAYREFRDDRVTFFLRNLARGNHSISYRMRAEIPGAFSALPTLASGMYAPELRGNSDEWKVKIEDQP
jgi:alpha-2-macroglobulin